VNKKFIILLFVDSLKIYLKQKKHFNVSLENKIAFFRNPYKFYYIPIFMDVKLKEISNQLLKSYESDDDKYRPSIFLHERTHEFIELRLLRELMFPRHWNADVKKTEDRLQELFNILSKITGKAQEIINHLPELREKLKTDVEAAYAGDPAATDYTDIIRTYPFMIAITIQRFAKILYDYKIPTYPRELTELAHSMTGIDINPGASIGKYFFIDHGTGVVIGETCNLGQWVRIYQDVTLGVLHFEKDATNPGIIKKDYKRHPDIGNNVVIGAGAKILGPIKIGNNVNVGANSWIQEDVPDHTTVFITEHPKLIKKMHK
jgi:serine O-acetyltransferase